MALPKQIIRESGTHAELQPGSGAGAELQPGMMGIATDRQQIEWREVVGVTMHTLLNFPDTGGADGNILFQGPNESAAEDSHLYWDDANNRLCVGGPTPQAQFTVYGGNSTGTVQAGTYALIEGTTDMWLGMLTLNTNSQGLLFGDEDDADVASVKYDHNTGRMTFTAETAETLAIMSGALTINRGVSGATALAAADELVVEGAADAGISILTPNGNVARIAASTVASSGLLQLIFDIGNENWRFQNSLVLGAALTIDSDRLTLAVDGRVTGQGEVVIESSSAVPGLTVTATEVEIAVDMDLRLGKPAGVSNVADQLVYGREPWDKFLVMEDSLDTTYYVLATTTNPA